MAWESIKAIVGVGGNFFGKPKDYWPLSRCAAFVQLRSDLDSRSRPSGKGFLNKDTHPTENFAYLYICGCVSLAEEKYVECCENTND